MKSPQEQARIFLAEAKQFQLGTLPTEARNPKTTKLSQLAESDLPSAIRLVGEVDREVTAMVLRKSQEIEALCAAIRATLNEGGRLFLCGCGATGRLSISLETLWREEVFDRGRPDLSEKVFSFIAGGDFALVRSIENFEDHPEFGLRQLMDLGFTENDLLISCTEGGETPFVIGATEHAAQFSKRKPYFLFCNEESILVANVERSRKVIENPRIEKICLPTGPMVLSGSTRMQATTVLMLAVGSAMFAALRPDGVAKERIEKFGEVLRTTDLTGLEPLIKREAQIYSLGQYCMHRTSQYGITVLTDTTERTPTFSILPFESPTDNEVKPAWTYLCIPDSQNSIEAWQRVLGRSPRPIEWPEIKEKFGMKKTLSYDFSPRSLERRRRSLGTENVHPFDIKAQGEEIVFSLDGTEVKIPRPKDLLCEHLLIKCGLNAASTLIMGRLGRFKSNLMLYVRPTNKKLIDRSIRYVRILLEDEGIQSTYEEVCYALLETFEHLPPNEPVVLRTFENLLKKKELRAERL